MPRAPWEAEVTAALASEDPAAALYNTDALEVGDLSGGPVSYNGRVEGESVELIRNENYANAGFTHRFWDDGSYALNGDVLYGKGAGEPALEFTEGPYLDRTVFTIVQDQSAAIGALVDGEIDYWLSSNVSPAVRRQGLEADNLAVTVNQSNGFNYVGFNLRKSPGKFLGFRQAMAYFDKENLTNNVLQGAFTPLYVMVPEGNEPWYNEEVAQDVAARYVGFSSQESLNLAYDALEADGFTWETSPEYDENGDVVSPGAGIIDPEGNAVPELKILGPPAAFRPELFATSLWLEDWAESLGIAAEAEPSPTFIFDHVWPGVDVEPDFDLYLLGWSLGNPAWPTFHGDFFHTRNMAETNDGGNSTGYSNPEFDALADAMLTETDEAVAFDQMWQMEQMLADDLPYIILFTTPVTEFHNKDLNFPFTQTLGGIQHLNGMPGLVDK
jgi:ABC-type transport system substrate-binding protein